MPCCARGALHALQRLYFNDSLMWSSRELVPPYKLCKTLSPYDFHLARIYFDIEWQLLFGYEGFDWPESPEQEPPLLERFFYSDLELNPGLTAADFDPDNPAYNYPGKKRK